MTSSLSLINVFTVIAKESSPIMSGEWNRGPWLVHGFLAFGAHLQWLKTNRAGRRWAAWPAFYAACRFDLQLLSGWKRDKRRRRLVRPSSFFFLSLFIVGRGSGLLGFHRRGGGVGMRFSGQQLLAASSCWLLRFFFARRLAGFPLFGVFCFFCFDLY
jgi:hypothetical protein